MGAVARDSSRCGIVGGLRWLTWLATGTNLRPPGSPCPWRPCRGGWSRSAGPVRRDPARPHGARRLGARSCCAASRPATTRAAGASTCACGWPNGSPRTSAPRASPGRPGSRGTRARWAPGSAAASTCTPCRRSPAAHVGDGASIEPEVDLAGYWLDGDTAYRRRHVTSARTPASARAPPSCPAPWSAPGAEVGPGSAVVGKVRPASTGRARPQCKVGQGQARGPWGRPRPAARRGGSVYAAVSLVIAGRPVTALAAGLASCSGPAPGRPRRGRGLLGHAAAGRSPWWLGFAVTAAARASGAGAVALAWPRATSRSAAGVGWQAWATERLLDAARDVAVPAVRSLVHPDVAAPAGRRDGTDAEASTVLLIPKLTSVGEGAFLADDTLVGGYELGGGWLRVDRTRVGKRAFLGNSGMAGPGRKVPATRWSRCCRPAPREGQGRIVLDRLAARCPCAASRRTDESLTYDPPRRCGWRARAVESWPHRRGDGLDGAGRRLGVAGRPRLAVASSRGGWRSAWAGSSWWPRATGRVVAAVLAKRLLVGPIRAGEHPLWSSFVWRNELADQFVEMVAAPWFARWAAGTPVLNVWLRARWAPASATGSGARRTGCPSPTSSRSARARPSRAASWCRPTCSTTGCWPSTRSSLKAGATLSPEQRRAARRVDRRSALDGRAGLARDARRVRAAPDALDRQPDRPVGRCGRIVRCASSLIPTCPGARRRPTRSTTTTSRSTTARPPTASTATRHPPVVALLETGALRLDLSGLHVDQVRWSAARPPEKVTPQGARAHVKLAGPAGRRRSALTLEVGLQRQARARSRAPRAGMGWEELDRRPPRRVAALRRPLVVPLQRPGRRQGDLPHRGHHRHRVHRRRHRTPHRRQRRSRTHHVDVRPRPPPTAPYLVEPRDRRLDEQPPWPASDGRGHGLVRPAPRSGRPRPAAAAARHAGRPRGLVRALPVPLRPVERWWWTSHSRSRSESQGDGDLRHQPPGRAWDSERLSSTNWPTSGSATPSPPALLSDIWLHEGFACYAEWLWSERRGQAPPTSVPGATTSGSPSGSRPRLGATRAWPRCSTTGCTSAGR